MSKIGFLTNKYSISVLILLACMGADVLLHKGMSRVMLPEKFTEKIQPYLLKPLQHSVDIKNKAWVHAVNTKEQLETLDPTVAGFECDLYFDTAKNDFFVYHDSLKISGFSFSEFMYSYKQKNFSSSLWLDLKNVTDWNAQMITRKINEIRDSFNLDKKIILETSFAPALPLFTKNGYFSSYYVPYLNPYDAEEDNLVTYLNSIASTLQSYPASALSGYYFQYPALKKFFPNYPFLTWSDRASASIISYSFNRQLEQDSMVKVILYKQ